MENANKPPEGFQTWGNGFRPRSVTVLSLPPVVTLSKLLYLWRRAWDRLLWPLGYLTDGSVPSQACNLHSVHRNDSLKSAHARLEERTPNATWACLPSADVNGCVSFHASSLLYDVCIMSISKSPTKQFVMKNICKPIHIWILNIPRNKEKHKKLNK